MPSVVCAALVMIQIIVRTLAGKTITLDVDSTYTVGEVKRKIQNEQGTFPERLGLFFSSRELKDGHSLASYNIKHESTILAFESTAAGRWNRLQDAMKLTARARAKATLAKCRRQMAKRAYIAKTAQVQDEAAQAEKRAYESVPLSWARARETKASAHAQARAYAIKVTIVKVAQAAVDSYAAKKAQTGRQDNFTHLQAVRANKERLGEKAVRVNKERLGRLTLAKCRCQMEKRALIASEAKAAQAHAEAAQAAPRAFDAVLLSWAWATESAAKAEKRAYVITKVEAAQAVADSNAAMKAQVIIQENFTRLQSRVQKAARAMREGGVPP